MKKNGLVQLISLIQGILGDLENLEYVHASQVLVIAGKFFKTMCMFSWITYYLILFEGVLLSVLFMTVSWGWI